MNAIEIEGLTKRFGDVLALDNLNLIVGEGSIFGFLGPNGAGKTTTQRVLVGLARPTSGTARILGQDIHGDTLKMRQKIGYLPETPAFYGWMTAEEYLRFTGDVFQIPGKKLKSKIDSLLKLADLANVKTKIRGYSRGMRQRLGIAQALVNDPEVLFLDEPTSALDPIGRKEVLDMIESLAQESTVFFSTHILNDVERVCDTVAILNKGRLMTESNLETLKEKYAQPTFLMEFDIDPATLEKQIVGRPWVVSTEREGNVLKVASRNMRMGQTELLRLIAESSVSLRNFQIVEPSLEDIFIKMVENDEWSSLPKERI